MIVDCFAYIDEVEATENMKKAFELYWYHYGDMDDPDKYESQEWITFRCAYKMSRENLVVELPNKLPHNQHDLDFKRIYASGFNDALKSCTDKIEEFGIKVK